MRLTIPYPPSANRIWRNARGRTILSKEALSFKRDVAILAKVARVKMLSGPVAVRMRVFRPHKRGDLDNRIKAVLDSLNGIAWEDDEQVETILATRHEDKNNPRVEIEVWSESSNDLFSSEAQCSALTTTTSPNCAR